MKIFFYFLLFVGLTCEASLAQNRVQQQRTGTPAPQPAKPRGPLPYVMKKDYDSSMIKLNNQISRLQGSINAVRGSIGNKDAQINSLQEKMNQVVEVLNSTNFKIASTSDSLSQTRLSLEEVQKSNEAKFVAAEQKDQHFDQMLMIVWGLIALAIILPLVIYLVMNGKVKHLHDELSNYRRHLESMLDENRDEQGKEINRIESLARAESRSVQQYAERMVGAAKEESNALRSEIDKMQSTIKVITGEVTELHEKINTKS